MVLLEVILVALILVVEIVDVVRHWNDYEKEAYLNCSSFFNTLTDSLRKQSGIRARASANTDTSPEEDGHSSRASKPSAADAASTNANTKADTARRFLRDQHRHVRQPFDH